MGKPWGSMKERGMDREWGLTYTADDPLPAIQAQSWSLIDRSREGEGGNRRSLEWSCTKHTPIQGATEMLINDKGHTRESMFSLHASDVVCRFRLVCNLLKCTERYTAEMQRGRSCWCTWFWPFSFLFCNNNYKKSRDAECNDLQISHAYCFIHSRKHIQCCKGKIYHLNKNISSFWYQWQQHISKTLRLGHVTTA